MPTFSMFRKLTLTTMLAVITLWSVLVISAHALHPPRPPDAPSAQWETGAAQESPVWGCPMCESVREPTPGTCSMCGMALVPMGGAPTSEASVPVMPGLPPWLFFSVALLVLVVSFVVVEIRGRGVRRPAHRFRLDLLRIPGLRWTLQQAWFPMVVQLPVVFLLGLVVAAGLFGNPAPDRNIAPVLTWTIWWAALILLVLFAGKLWCTVCPWIAIADWLGKILPRLERPWPQALRNIWPATLFFVFLTWLELGYDVTGKPWLTAVLGLAMVLLSIVTVLVFERRAFCRYACLVGRVSGLYATFAGTELRASNFDTCRTCVTKDCYRGNERGAPCPTHEYLGTMRENTYCTLCLECVKTCPEDNVALNIRPFGSDLMESIRPRKDEAYLAVILLSMTAFHGLTMTPSWDRVVRAIDGATGVGWLAAFSVGMTLMLLFPLAIYYGICVLMAWCARDRRHDAGTLFVRFSYSLLPIALFYHLAHNLQHILFEGTKLLRISSDPFGWGWNLFGTAHMPVGAVLPVEVGWAVQAVLIIVGHVYAIVITHRTAHGLYSDPRAVTASQLPMIAAMLLFSFQSLWLLSQPMLMRTAM